MKFFRSFSSSSSKTRLNSLIQLKRFAIHLLVPRDPGVTDREMTESLNRSRAGQVSAITRNQSFLKRILDTNPYKLAEKTSLD